jgi:uncharacterized protein
MDIEYDWAFKYHGNQLLVHMKNLQRGTQLFNATLSLQAEPLSPKALNRVLWTYPLMTLKVVVGYLLERISIVVKTCAVLPTPAILIGMNTDDE